MASRGMTKDRRSRPSPARMIYRHPHSHSSTAAHHAASNYSSARGPSRAIGPTTPHTADNSTDEVSGKDSASAPVPLARKRSAALLVRLFKRAKSTPAAAAYRAVLARPGLRSPAARPATQAATAARSGIQSDVPGAAIPAEGGSAAK